MKKNLHLIAINELGDPECLASFYLPEAETMTRDEVEAFKTVLLIRNPIFEEAHSYYWREEFRTRTERDEEEAEQQRLYEELFEECDGDEDMAWDMLMDTLHPDVWY